MATPPRGHIEKIRRNKFSIGGRPNSLRDDLNNAVTYLSTELYAKDVHFLMELIQNSEDNEYDDGITPSLEFVMTNRDITATGAATTLLIFNNEKGFSSKDIESVCSVGSSTKKGKRKQGYIGEKGIGFKSVFLITQQPYIFSNGYRIRFNEEPSSDCSVQYIVPEWVDDYPTISTIKQIYGSKSRLPATTIVLPLKAGKIESVKHQLSTIHPKILLFLSKIKKLSVKEDCGDSGLRTVTSISIVSETCFRSRNTIDASSYLLYLSSDENKAVEKTKCGYHMWRQRFPVTSEHRVDIRKEVEEWVLTLSFPTGQRLNRGMYSPGVYAFLPTEMCTNFPFIIQADFILASSRETILMDNNWNQGILNCVPSAFVNAFCSLVKTSGENAPMSTLVCMFEFLPVNSSSYSVLNDVRDKIKAKLGEENIVPCGSYTRQKCFKKPSEVSSLDSDFRSILDKAVKQGVNLRISSHGRYILNSSFDNPKHNMVLDFLGVKPVEAEWYVKFIRDSNLIMGVSDDVYLELLLFIAKNWDSHFFNTKMNDIPILKYVMPNGDISVCTLNEQFVDFTSIHDQISWLIGWNKEFRCVNYTYYFMPMSTQLSLHKLSNKQELIDWLSTEANVLDTDVSSYASTLSDNILTDVKLVISFMHFLYHSHSQGYLEDQDIRELSAKVPIVDNYGKIHFNCKNILVPSNGSKWADLLGVDPWKEEGYIELSESYLSPGLYAGNKTAFKELIQFLNIYFAASDLPAISPPAATIPTMSGPLTKENAFLVFKWIRYLRQHRVVMPEKFLNCIQSGKWLKISFGESSDYMPPSQSFLPSSSWGCLLQHVDIPIIDQTFYGDEIVEYKDELKQIGVMFEYGEACKIAGKHLMTLAASSSLTKRNAFKILKLIRFLREKMLSPVEFINSVKYGRWLRTSKGFRSPVGSVLCSQEWKVVSQICDIPFIDQDYYGQEILSFKVELELLGIIIQFNNNYKLVADCLKPSISFRSLSANCTLLILKCIRNLMSNNNTCCQFVALKGKIIFKTNKGYMSPAESYLPNSQWGSILQVFNVFPLIDVKFYGSAISLYENELKWIGVKVDFETACREFDCVFKDLASRNCISSDNVLSFLECWRRLTDLCFRFPESLQSSIKNEKWLRTTLCDYRSPKECILFGAEWESISAISRLPFVDDSEEYYGKAIHKYTKELKIMGVNTSFKDCYHFVFEGFSLISPSNITPASVYSLLDCIRNSQFQIEPLPKITMMNFQWVKTTVGYRNPVQLLFFNSNMYPLTRFDGPFIDEEFYGPNILSYMDEFNALGNISNISLLARHLEFHSNLDTITRIYNYLNSCNWVCGDDEIVQIWIPTDCENGMWVTAENCVICDADNLFSTELNVLENYYGENLQAFFSNAFKVRHYPSLDDYLKLWKVWEGSRDTLSHAECFAFWRIVHNNWTLKTGKTLTDELVKLPVYSGLGDIILCLKEDVFIADDLQLKDLFQRTSSKPLFAWYPVPSSSLLPWEKLLSIYRKIGVRTITECVTRDDSYILDEVKLEQVTPSQIFICKALLKLILGFLGNSSLKMESKERHEFATKLLNTTIFETEKPVSMSYSLSLSNGENVSATMTKMIGWDSENSKLFYQKRDGLSFCKRRKLEFATNYSVTISEGLLWEYEDEKYKLAELIKLGLLLKFDEDAIDFLMRSENLQLFSEDDEFLSRSFPSGSPESSMVKLES